MMEDYDWAISLLFKQKEDSSHLMYNVFLLYLLYVG